MTETYMICSPYLPAHDDDLPPSVCEQAAALERVDNVRVVRGLGRSAAVERMKLWDNGRTLRVTFLDGDPDVQAKVETIAKEWEREANLTLRFVADRDAEIRISFAQQGFSWSTVGTDALTVRRGRPTMNYGWLTQDTQLREYQRVVRHEFGHALGMIHEHQNPAAFGRIPWDKPRVYDYYAEQGWSKADVDHNIFEVYDEESTNHTTFDPNSIMEYAIPDSLTLGSYSIPFNTELSPLDRQFMRRQYPKGGPGRREVVANDDPIKSDLGLSGEVDTYQFTVTEPRVHVMETSGPTDTVLTLHGPSDPGAVLAYDDDHGVGHNARIVRKLVPGEYWLSVRHGDPAAIGTYALSLRTREALPV